MVKETIDKKRLTDKIEVLYSVYFRFGNRIYQGDYNNRAKPMFKDVTEQFKAAEKLSENIAEKIKDKVDVKKILVEAFMHQEFKDIKRLADKVFNKKTDYKVKTRKHHCCDLQIGNQVIGIN